MEYTIDKLAKLAGISTRTLRYYDERDLLKPCRINTSGYRIYAQPEVDRLQQILFYRALGVTLEQIKAILSDPSFDEMEALSAQRERLCAQKEQLEKLIANVEKTIAVKEGRRTMSDQEKFEGFKQKMLEENERKYGKEIREKYGDETVDRSYDKLRNMTKEQGDALEKRSLAVNDALKAALETGDPASAQAQYACKLHKEWLSFYWDSYTPEAHAGLARMYVDDARFRAYYDKIAPGAAEFLRDAILIYTGMD